MTTSLYNNLAIQMYPQPLNNRPVKRYGAIFRHVREDFIDITTRACMHRETHCMGLNFKSMFLESIKRESRILITKFCQSIKRKPRKQIPPKSGIKLVNYFLFGLVSFSRQAEITQAERLVFSCVDYLVSIPRDCNSFRIILFIQPASDSSPSSFCAFSIACRNSGSNLNWNGGLPRLFSVMCIDTPITSMIMCLRVMTHYHYIIKKTMPRSDTNTVEASNQTIKQEVMIMANRYDSAHLRAEQSKLFKFYDLSIIDKKRLHEFQNLGYINLALAKSSVRIGTLNYSTATHDALSVFFCVNTCARLFIKSFSMVALVGHPKGWLDSVGASSSNPANVTANEIGTSSGDYNNQPTEAVIMTTTPNPIVSTQKLFKFYDLSTAQVIQTTATTEREARKSLGKQSLIFIARIRLTPIIERARTWGGYSHE